MAVITTTLQPLIRSDRPRAVLRAIGVPAIVGDADPGITWTCPGCGKQLAIAVWENQLVDLLFNCEGCGTLSSSPRREPGNPLPTTNVTLAPRRRTLRTSIDVRGKPVFLASKSALDGYVHETGASYGGRGHLGRSKELNEAFLRDAARDAQRLLGKHYERLAEADRKGLASATPPHRRHRLIELIAYAEAAANRFATRKDDEPIEIDADALCEIMTTIAVFDRWRNHPMWPALRDSLQSGEEVQHSVMTLAVASLLVDAHDGVGLVNHEGAGNRVCDLWLVPRIIERVEVEVKTPLPLRHGKDFEEADAMKIVVDVVDNAASTKRGQLNPAHTGIVAVGAFNLGKPRLDRLEQAVRGVLQKQAKEGRKKHLMAAVVFESHMEIGATIQPALEHRIVMHPAYHGDISLSHAAPAGWTPGQPLA